jgi:hypothetical protein
MCNYTIDQEQAVVAIISSAYVNGKAVPLQDTFELQCMDEIDFSSILKSSLFEQDKLIYFARVGKKRLI